VGRPREFDEETVLEAAMDAFWRQGYEATSMTDLCAATGLHKGSLYQAFGDKHQLYLRSLRHYTEQSFKEVASSAYLSDSPLENLRALLHKVAASCVADQGCLAVNSMVELAPHDPDVKALLDHVYMMRLRLLTDLIDKAQRAGEITIEQTPDRLAKLIMVTLAGVAATVKGFLSADEASAVIEDLLNAWM
jgi:TetR/AcrR family transcriptional repressor of nem operon